MVIAKVKVDDRGRIQLPQSFLKGNGITTNTEIEVHTMQGKPYYDSVRLNGFFMKSSAPDFSSWSISSCFMTPLTIIILMFSNSGFLLIVWQTTLPLISGSI